MEEWPETNDYDNLDLWREEIKRRQLLEIQRVKTTTGITRITLIRQLANVKPYIRNDNTVVTRRGQSQWDYNPTHAQLKNLARLGYLQFKEQRFTLADCFKWSNGKIPPSFAYSVTDEGLKIFNEIREHYWYD